MKVPGPVAVDMGGPLRRQAEPVEHPEKAAAFDEIDKLRSSGKPSTALATSICAA